MCLNLDHTLLSDWNMHPTHKYIVHAVYNVLYAYQVLLKYDFCGLHISPRFSKPVGTCSIMAALRPSATTATPIAATLVSSGGGGWWDGQRDQSLSVRGRKLPLPTRDEMGNADSKEMPC